MSDCAYHCASQDWATDIIKAMSHHMPSLSAIALSTLMRMVVKPSFAAMHGVEDLRGSAARLFNRVPVLAAGTCTAPAPLPTCAAEWVYPRGIETDRVVLYIPGGAFVMRTPRVHRALAGRIAKAAHARALVVFYRLAPEYPFPCGLDDCIAAYEGLLADGIPSSRIVVGGDSAGGNLTLALLCALRDRGCALPAAGFAISPVTDLRDHMRGSRTANQQADPILSTLHRNRMNVHELYVGRDRKLLEHPNVSPVLADFSGLPPMMFQVGSSEILLDDSRLAVDKARRAGSAAVLEIWSHMPHVWHAWNLPESRRAIGQLGDFIRGHCP
jgi:acetyl esterase/lipase